MKTVTLKVKGAASGLVETMNFDCKKVADAIQEELSGYPSTELRASYLTQEFVDKHNICAKYSSGTFMGFKISDEASDEFATFPKK